jgi:hypothetical protein
MTSTVFERPFADGRLAIRLSSEAVTFPFVDFAQALADEYQGDIVERVGFLGTDEIYWDIRIRGHVLTLHSQHFIGVFLCASDEASEQCLREAVPFVEEYLSGHRRAGLRGWMKKTWRRFRAMRAVFVEAGKQ